MRTFIMKARQGTTRWQRIREQLGGKGHFEVIAHSIINAFFVSNGFRDDVEFYLVLDSSERFPHTIRLSSQEGLSIPGFHEDAIITLIENTLRASSHLAKNGTITVAPGIQVSGFGLEKLLGQLVETRAIYLLDSKGEDIRTSELKPNPVFLLTDHLAMPKKTFNAVIRQCDKTISFGKKILFASQCVVLINHELDLQ